MNGTDGQKMPTSASNIPLLYKYPYCDDEDDPLREWLDVCDLICDRALEVRDAGRSGGFGRARTERLR